MGRSFSLPAQNGQLVFKYDNPHFPHTHTHTHTLLFYSKVARQVNGEASDKKVAILQVHFEGNVGAYPFNYFLKIASPLLYTHCDIIFYFLLNKCRRSNGNYSSFNEIERMVINIFYNVCNFYVYLISFKLKFQGS